MKTFSEWINEAYRENPELEITGKGHAALSHLYQVTKRSHNYIDDLQMDIYDNKKGVVDKFFSKYDDSVKDLESVVDKWPVGNEPHEQLLRKKEKKNIEETIKQYYAIKDGYKKFEEVIQKIFKTIKIGETQEKALPKIAKMTKEIKYFSVDKLQYNGHFFEEYTVEDLENQIERFHGAIKLNAPLDFYIIFKDGKVSRTYF